MIDLLRANGKFYKANLHCHSTISDGKMTPEQIKEYYKKHGYSIVAFSDHNVFVQHPELCDKEFLAVPSIEVDFSLNKEGVATRRITCHMNFYAKNINDQVISYEREYDISYINEFVKKMSEKGWLCTLNHPEWSLQPTEDVLALDKIHAIEVFNYHNEKTTNNGYSNGYYSQYIASSKKAFSVFADDTHCGVDQNGNLIAPSEACGGFIFVSMSELSYEAFYNSLKEGRFYPSTGVEIKEFYLDEEKDELVIKSSPVCVVVVKSGLTWNAERRFSNKDDITESRFSMKEIRKTGCGAVWIELRTLDGKRANTQPFYYRESK